MLSSRMVSRHGCPMILDGVPYVDPVSRTCLFLVIDACLPALSACVCGGARSSLTHFSMLTHRSSSTRRSSSTCRSMSSPLLVASLCVGGLSSSTRRYASSPLVVFVCSCDYSTMTLHAAFMGDGDCSLLARVST
jgi:hypothetical protein